MSSAGAGYTYDEPVEGAGTDGALAPAFKHQGIADRRRGTGEKARGGVDGGSDDGYSEGSDEESEVVEDDDPDDESYGPADDADNGAGAAMVGVPAAAAMKPARGRVGGGAGRKRPRKESDSSDDEYDAEAARAELDDLFDEGAGEDDDLYAGEEVMNVAPQDGVDGGPLQPAKKKRGRRRADESGDYADADVGAAAQPRRRGRAGVKQERDDDSPLRPQKRPPALPSAEAGRGGGARQQASGRVLSTGSSVRRLAALPAPPAASGAAAAGTAVAVPIGATEAVTRSEAFELDLGDLPYGSSAAPDSAAAPPAPAGASPYALERPPAPASSGLSVGLQRLGGGGGGGSGLKLRLSSSAPPQGPPTMGPALAAASAAEVATKAAAPAFVQQSAVNPALGLLQQQLLSHPAPAAPDHQAASAVRPHGFGLGLGILSQPAPLAAPVPPQPPRVEAPVRPPPAAPRPPAAHRPPAAAQQQQQHSGGSLSGAALLQQRLKLAKKSAKSAW